MSEVNVNTIIYRINEKLILRKLKKNQRISKEGQILMSANPTSISRESAQLKRH